MGIVLRLIFFAAVIAAVVIKASSADAAATALNNNYYNVIAPTFDGSNGDLSYIRLGNGGAASTTFAVTVVGSPSGQSYGTAQFPVPPGASLQYSLTTILDAAHAGPLSNGDTGYSLYMQDADASLFYQHVIFNEATKSFSNISLCHNDASVDYAALNAGLSNVHTSRIVGYPSRIYVHNYATSAATYDVTIADAVSGTAIGTFPLTFPANSTYSALFTVLQTQAQWAPTAGQTHANMRFVPRSPATFQIEIGHFVTSQQTGVSVNMSDRCGFVSSSAAQTAFVGTLAGASLQSGTFSMKVNASMAAAAALHKTSAVEKAAAAVSATATVQLSGGVTITVSGTYEAGTGAVTLQGSGYTLTGTVEAGVYSGSYTGPNGASGNFAGLIGTRHSVRAYCGTYSEQRPPSEGSITAGGVFNVQIAADGAISGDTSSTFGSGQHVGVFTGHAVGATAYLVHASAGKDPVEIDEVIGTIQGDTLSGTYPGGVPGTGTFSGTVCAVPAS